MLFKPHPEIPNHYLVSEHCLIRSDDLENFGFNWSRAIYNNFIEDRGHLTLHGAHRTIFYGFKQDTYQEYHSIDLKEIAEAFEGIYIPNTLTVVHYFSDGQINCIVTGVEPTQLVTLSNAYKSFYYDFN